ncbi:MAG TPA: DUF4253 domain-containing protein [Nitrospirota bacterium]|nr:DUF4253 domain-containing protein [Nitrospirota bacterium]
MKKIYRQFFCAIASAGAVLMIMGANSQVSMDVNSGVSGSATGKTANALRDSPNDKIITTMTTSSTSTITTGVTSSVASKITNSVGGNTGDRMKSRITSSTTGTATSNLTSSSTSSVVSKGTGSQVTLSPRAEELAKTIKFDRQVLIIVKQITQERITRLVGYDEDNYQIVAPGIAVSVPEENTDKVLADLRNKLLPLHYMPFIVEINPGLKLNKIGIIKGSDQYEILRIMHTDGDEYDISNQDVIERLKEWQKISSFDIIGADSDWVEIQFKKLPGDLKSFVHEVYEFSPDAVERVPNGIEKLIEKIKRTKRLFLLWE